MMNEDREYDSFVAFRVRVNTINLKETLEIFNKYDEDVDPNPCTWDDYGIITLDMSEHKDYMWLKNLLDEEIIDRKRSDVFISLCSEYDSDIINIPKWVITSLHMLDVNAVFSYTIV